MDITDPKIQRLINSINVVAVEAREGQYGSTGSKRIYLGPDLNSVDEYIKLEVPGIDPQSKKEVSLDSVIAMALRSSSFPFLMQVLKLFRKGEKRVFVWNGYSKPCTSAKVKEGFF